MRRSASLDRRSLIFSIVLHGSIVGVVWLSMLRTEPSIEFVSYAVELVSPPPAVEADEYTPPSEQLVVERPEPTPAPPEPEPEPEPQATITEPEPEPEPAQQPEPAPPEPSPPASTNEPEPRPEPPADPTPAAGPDADSTAERSGEGINVRMEGLRRDFPEYYNNIIRQIQRCWRPSTTGNLITTVTFVIHRDGSVDDVEFERRSGNTAYDYQAMEAVECAGEGRFGPLPAEMAQEYQPIRFEFERR